MRVELLLEAGGRLLHLRKGVNGSFKVLPAEGAGGHHWHRPQALHNANCPFLHGPYSHITTLVLNEAGARDLGVRVT